MRILLTRLVIGTFLLVLLWLGVASTHADKLALSVKDNQSVLSGSEVIVTIIVPEGTELTGTAIITLEDITFQDQPSVELAKASAPASALLNAQSTIAVPFDLQVIDPKATINVAVHIDADNSGTITDGDWLSDSIVIVINNSKFDVAVSLVKI